MPAESTPGESSKPKSVLKFRMPDTPMGKLPRRFLKASDVVVAKPERVRKPLMQKTKRTYSAASGTPRPERATAARSVLDMLTAAPGTERPERAAAVHTVLDMLTKKKAGCEEPLVLHEDSEQPLQPTKSSAQPVMSPEKYVQDVMTKIAAGAITPDGKNWIMPPSPFQKALDINNARSAAGEKPIDAEEALALVLWPPIFAWAPEFSVPSLQIRCPTCTAMASHSRWWRPRVLHGLSNHAVYICREHTCSKCTAGAQAGKKKTFLGDSPDALASLPQHVASSWDLVNTGRKLCDAGVVALVRAMATKTSWCAAADILNELKTTWWVKHTTLQYLRLCELLHLTPVAAPAHLPTKFRVTDEWVRNLFVRDAASRHIETLLELQAETGDDVLVLDWTKDAATRCRGFALLNAMDGHGHILLSRLTATCSPVEAKGFIAELAQRNVYPKVVYVDDGCCSTWPQVLRPIWPNTAIRLDAMHALRRLTQTVASTQHPWHGEFCSKLSEAVYKYDPHEVARLVQARATHGQGRTLPNKVRNKFVPRTISNAGGIIQEVEATLAHYARKVHEHKGCLITDETLAAWQNLKNHVDNGCICDPPGIVLHEFGKEVLIGGDTFREVRARRGASALEGFHTHQKAWFGPLAQHGEEAGQAILLEGSVRWNRKRKGDKGAPMVFEEGLLRAVDGLYQTMTGDRVYPALAAASD